MYVLGSMGKEERKKVMLKTLEKDRQMKLKAKKRPENRKAKYLLNDCMICSNHAVNRVREFTLSPTILSTASPYSFASPPDAA